MQLDQFLTYLTTEKRYSPHTVTAYRTDILSFLSFLKEEFEVSIEKDVTPVMIRSFIVSLMEQGMHPKSVNRKISSVKAYFRYLRKRELLDSNPTATIKSVKAPKILVQTVSEDEILGLLDQGYFNDTPEGYRSRAIIELLYATGMRRAELIDLKLEHLDRKANTLRVTGKRNKTRIVPVPQPAMEAIEFYLNQRGKNKGNEPYLFLTDKGKKLYPALVYNTVKRYLSYVSTLKKRSPHVLRHTFATHLLNKGADMNDIKELLGHANLSATQVYTHNSFEKLKSVYIQSHPRETKKE